MIINNNYSSAGVSYNTSTTRKSGGFSLPSIPDSITTKGQSKLSEEEIQEKLLEMARRNTATGVYSGNPYYSSSSEWLNLQKNYVSSASPDRKGIINNTLSGLGQKLSAMMPNIDRSLNLLTLLMQNSRLFGSKDIGNNFIDFKDASGVTVASYCQLPSGGMGFMECPTNAEVSRGHEFMQMWYDAQIQAGEEKRNADTTIDIVAKGGKIDIGKLIKDGAHFDMAKLAAHGITYDATTGQTNVDRAKLEQIFSRSGSQTQQNLNVKA